MTSTNPRVGHEFVEFIPETLEPATVYISVKYKAMAHLCFCGCGYKVITPLSPTGWNIRFNGKEISIHPSIGNWNLPCKSHYWITHSEIEWSDSWSERKIKAGFERDQRIKREYYGEITAPKGGRSGAAGDVGDETGPPRSWWGKRKKKR